MIGSEISWKSPYETCKCHSVIASHGVSKPLVVFTFIVNQFMFHHRFRSMLDGIKKGAYRIPSKIKPIRFLTNTYHEPQWTVQPCILYQVLDVQRTCLCYWLVGRTNASTISELGGKNLEGRRRICLFVLNKGNLRNYWSKVYYSFSYCFCRQVCPLQPNTSQHNPRKNSMGSNDVGERS